MNIVVFSFLGVMQEILHVVPIIQLMNEGRKMYAWGKSKDKRPCSVSPFRQELNALVSGFALVADGGCLQEVLEIARDVR
ncbi:hypothetical protein KL86DES1_22287 [uncultured Desulfovibrio sp.]|uniref:Uncharacterized protein n=1 Tax=uncultured Desulfovibrio sp. TaxID=167968 RepID=A0A212LBR8_9BACT|nr:hypothetical protein KL86DES1_22287 [uncultured Desulfovibrio sp.]VZH35180.1 conserved protein of unknown function [Desulfovibrio sp. 86]